MRSLDEFACGKLAALERARLRRTPVVTARDGIFAERGGRRLLSFSCNDYLNLSRHPAIIKAAVEAAQRYGVGAGASRLVTGNHPLYDELGKPAGAAERHRGGVRFRLRLSRQYRHHPGAGRQPTT